MKLRSVTLVGVKLKTMCRNCGHEFTYGDGGGFVFHLLRCDECGAERMVRFDELGDIHLCYLKGLPGPYCIATSEYDKHVKEHYPGEPLDEKEYNKLVEEFAGNCKKKGCSGKYKFDAPPRCPKCRSTKLDEGSMMMLYD
jgi:predicted Zn-ribbon and HTH transcriptional regulator